jgi:CRISP-associated protein Cas1
MTKNSIEVSGLSAKRARLRDCSEIVIETIKSFRQEGYSFRAIGVEVGLSHGSVGRLYKSKTEGNALENTLNLPSRPKSSSLTTPDFAWVAKLTAKGKTVKEVWRLYAQQGSRPYCYTHFSQLFRAWLDQQKSGAPIKNGIAVPDFSVPEYVASKTYWQDRINPRSSVFVLHGHGCSLKIEQGNLVAWDGNRHKESGDRRFQKVTHGLSAIIFLGSSGLVTFDAIKWLEAQGISLFVLGWYGELISVSQPALSASIELRRAQFSADRLHVAKAILGQKLISGARIGKLSKAASNKAIARMKAAKTVNELFPIEAEAALDYWSNWRFPLKHHRRNWPDQWTEFSYRASAISGGPRHATHPVNAILNYAYSAAAAFITRALAVEGFDPACGFLHADADGRYSLSYDVLELLRADIDAAILPWVASQTWKRADFPVTPEGVVRLTAPLAAVVAQRATLRQKMIDGAVHWLHEQLAPMHHLAVRRPPFRGLGGLAPGGGLAKNSAIAT